ncbi:MAG: redoxin domain-containing protein [Candidatus Hydrogenedentes bacterium]|nr:redoxin domain-containing protein [Candidatus Hydrogenedentota bacterium]
MSIRNMRARVAVWTLAAIMMIAPLGLATAQEEEAVVLKVGDAAPDFSLPGSDGKTYTLAQFKGEKEVVLAFFFKAFTPG